MPHDQSERPSGGPFDGLPDWAQSAGEVGIGAAILAVRRLNIVRNEIGEQYGPAGEAIEQGIGLVEDALEPLGEQLDDALKTVADTAPKPVSDYATAGRKLLQEAPRLARLAGLQSRR